jgi:rod shape-determining protein MreD
MKTQVSTRRGLILKIIYYSIALLTICVVQLSFFFLISISGVTPDLLILLTIWITLAEGRFFGLFAGFLIGIFFDFVSMNLVGVNALTKTVVAFVAGLFYKEGEFSNIIRTNKFFVIVILSTLLHNILYYLILIDLTSSDFGFNYFKFTFGSTLYTLLASVPFYFLRIRRFW